jgi:hypothetical protein
LGTFCWDFDDVVITLFKDLLGGVIASKHLFAEFVIVSLKVGLVGFVINSYEVTPVSVLVVTTSCETAPAGFVIIVFRF